MTIQLILFVIAAITGLLSYRFMPAYYLEPGTEGALRPSTPQELRDKKVSDILEWVMWGCVVLMVMCVFVV